MAANRMSRFEIFVGTWNTRGEVLETDAAPASTLVATDIYTWLPGRHFILHEVDARFGGDVSRSVEIMGYDRERRKHVARSYDDQGVSQSFDVTLDGKRWRISGDSVRFDGKFDASRNRLTGLWELKGSRGRWQPWIELELQRA